ncbi:hypothetical protein ACFPM0_01080 [Pseudonocardia sulfidoxydans]|uniref:hypothetical protein n=1 Tax=Pseudonocardia sulfidoxydans TaxID=54011 RepID=UPI003621E61B
MRVARGPTCREARSRRAGERGERPSVWIEGVVGAGQAAPVTRSAGSGPASCTEGVVSASEQGLTTRSRSSGSRSG